MKHPGARPATNLGTRSHGLGAPALAVMAACAYAGCAESGTAPPSVASLPPLTTAHPLAHPSSSAKAPPIELPVVTPPVVERQKQFAPIVLTADVARLPKSERDAMDRILAAARLMDPIFLRQAYAGNPALRAKLAELTTDVGKATLAYFDIMRGPWDRQDHFLPFATTSPRPKGAGFYPEDLSAAEFRAYVGRHPGQKAALESLTTLVVRDGSSLRTVPYSQAYKEWLVPAAESLRDASRLTTNATLKRFLVSRADAFLSDDYYPSDKAWMDLDSDVEVTIGPYENYEDELLGLKAAFEAFVTVTDPAESRKLATYKALLPSMEQNLPVPAHVKTKRGAESPIRVADLVFSSGDARKSVQTIAFNLPNDERVRAEKGAKKVLLRNLIQSKFDKILRPIAERVLAAPHLADLTADAFFYEVLFHELSHSLGPAFTMSQGKKVEIRIALGPTFSALEEAKADVMGAYNILYMIDRGELPRTFRKQLLVTYFAGLFRSARFGVAEAHGKGAALQINRLVEEGAARFDESSKRYSVDLRKLEVSIRNLVRDLCMIQHRGDPKEAEAFLGKYGVLSPNLTTALGSLTVVPVDVRPTYPLAGE